MDLRASDYLTAISDTDGDDFQGFKYFLDNPGKTSQENVELLAWLINFQVRPYSKFVDAGNDSLDIFGLEEVDHPIIDREDDAKQRHKVYDRKVLQHRHPYIK